jgi:hypothetical protein
VKSESYCIQNNDRESDAMFTVAGFAVNKEPPRWSELCARGRDTLAVDAMKSGSQVHSDFGTLNAVRSGIVSCVCGSCRKSKNSMAS